MVVTANRVVEMNDRLVEIYAKDQRAFLVKFYAPWCHHCQELEPTWVQVAQQLHNLDSNIVVGRVDCTKHLKVASHFSIRGFPTILYINAQKQIEFKGDRNRDEIIDFALRVHGPPIRYLSSCDQLKDLVADEKRVIFVNFGPEADSNFTRLATAFQQHDWFFRSLIVCSNFEAGIYALKSRNFMYKFDYDRHLDLSLWIKRHRFPHFTRFTNTNLHMALHTQKLLAIAVVDEHRHSGKTSDQKSQFFKQMMDSLARTYQDSKDLFLFGYSSDLNTINSVAIRTIDPVPNLFVLNSTTFQYFLFSDNIVDQSSKWELSQTNVLKFLNAIAEKPEQLVTRGGDTYFYRITRLFFDLISTIVTMYYGNPVLTLLLFGLPGSFLAIIIYMTCCSDLLDARDDDLLDEDEQEHAKRE